LAKPDKNLVFMIDTKVTLQNLHQRFPDMNLDDLFAILECIAEYPVGITYTSNWNENQILSPKIY